MAVRIPLQHEGARSMAKFAKAAKLLSQPAIAFDISDDGQAGTCILQDVGVSVGGLRRAPLRQSQMITLSIPIYENDHPVTVASFIAGAAVLDQGVNATLIIQISGQLSFTVLSGPTDEGKENFEHRFDPVVSTDADYVATIVLLIEKTTDDPALGGYLQVDSLDFSLNSDRAAKN
jgi:hypothetical protein